MDRLAVSLEDCLAINLAIVGICIIGKKIQFEEKSFSS
jgi:hypothetical protein